MTIGDLLNSISTDASTIAADQAKLTADQATQTVDDETFMAGLSAAGVTAFSVVAPDGNSVATYTMVSNSTPPYTEVITPTAQSITIPAPTPAPTPAPAA